MNPERMLTIGDVELCVQTVGRPDDPAILLVHGACASMLWWEPELCERLAAGRRFVVRYDQRDTGRSSSFPPGRPGYALSDLTGDAIGILDALGVERAHFVGRSMSGGLALIAGVDHPDRVASLTFLSTTTGDPDLPDPTPEFRAATAASGPDLANRAAVVEHVVAGVRAYYGSSPFFDERATRALAEADVARTRDLAAALGNHWAMTFDGPRRGGFADVGAPTLVVHGELDPVLPLAHGVALQHAVPGAELLVLDRTGHELPRQRWDEFVGALLRHTAPRS